MVTDVSRIRSKPVVAKQILPDGSLVMSSILRTCKKLLAVRCVTDFDDITDGKFFMSGMEKTGDKPVAGISLSEAIISEFLSASTADASQ